MLRARAVWGLLPHILEGRQRSRRSLATALVCVSPVLLGAGAPRGRGGQTLRRKNPKYKKSETCRFMGVDACLRGQSERGCHWFYQKQRSALAALDTGGARLVSQTVPGIPLNTVTFYCASTCFYTAGSASTGSGSNGAVVSGFMHVVS